MKNIKISLAIILLAMLAFTSCGKKAKDINVNELETACELVDAMELVIDEVIVVMGDKTSREALDADQLKELEALTSKLDEIDKFAQSKFEKAEAEKCPNWSKLEEKGKKAEGGLR